MDVAWFDGWGPIARTLLAAVAIYVLAIALLRVSGPRTLAKWYAFDLIVTVALGSVVATGLLSRQVSIAQAGAALALLVLLQFVVGRRVVGSRSSCAS